MRSSTSKVAKAPKPLTNSLRRFMLGGWWGEFWVLKGNRGRVVWGVENVGGGRFCGGNGEMGYCV